MKLQEQLKAVRDATMARMPKSVIDTFTNSIENIRNDQLQQKALQVGDTIPNIPLIDNYGNSIDLKEIQQNEFLILNFYRGGWCPYCNMELREFERLRDAFKKADTDIVAISAELPQLATQTVQKNTISYPILTDRNAAFMKAIGIVFELDEASKKEFDNFGMDFSKIHGNHNNQLPVPAIYVIDRHQKIVFIHFEADYMTRMEPSELLKTLKMINYSKNKHYENN
ncbi:peroxiredoxin-like family protein [uncultured Kordia sp.]|uniref:peroxiredoxin-like family protein n=1 Tax=uncultured Kordia sp. TaxID=507699 RepID=UPI002633F8A1|nr:peroxiredoxin-like family protein [uncultured Kordia sp.]